MEISIFDDLCGKNVLYVLKTHLKLSSKIIADMKKNPRGILVNGKHVTVRYLLNIGDVLSLSVEDTETDVEASSVVPTELPIDILYEDDDVIIINKPAGMPTHPSHGHFDDTLANALCYHYRSQNIPFVFRPITRLDKDTSGAVLVAKNKISAASLSKQMFEKRINKKYIAILEGILDCEGKVETYMRRAKEGVILREVCDASPEAEYSKTLYRPIALGDNFSLVEATPITGRTHQLRLHFSSIGHPILGDWLYGKESCFIHRHALHAASVSFLHPKTQTRIDITAPLPQDMERAANLLIYRKGINNE